MRHRILIITILSLLLCTAVLAADYPQLTGFVNDFASILTPTEEQDLTTRIGEIEKNTTVEIAVVTVKDTAGEAPIMYANHLGEQNGVGKKEADNGVVVLWSLDNEKGGAIATGRGIEGTLTDAVVSTIGRTARPEFDQGKYYDGFVYIVTELGKELKPEEQGVGTPKRNFSFLLIVLVVGIGLIIIGIGILSLLKDQSSEESYSSSSSRRSRSGGSAYRAASYAGTSSWSGSSSGSSGFSFGGGSFGGGGGGF